MDLGKDTISRYERLYREVPEALVSAPGRVNIIGEHTDENGGFVLPIAIDRRVFVAAGRRIDNVLNLFSADLQAHEVVRLSELAVSKGDLWRMHPQSVGQRLRKAGHKLAGMNMCFRGNVPAGAGLGSSAALDVACAITFSRVCGLSLSPLDLIGFARGAGSDVAGAQRGVMDHFTAMMGKEGHALFLDCKTLEFRHVPCPPGVQFVLCSTGAKSETALAVLEKRRVECAEAVALLSRHYPGISSLRDVSHDDFHAAAGSLPPALRLRALHVLSENDRVVRGVEAMKNNDMRELGQLMYESHNSMREQYEVSSKELDVLVEVAAATPGVYGARMTGTGSSGSAICIVHEDALDDFVDRLKTDYTKRAGLSLTIYLTVPSEGASVSSPNTSPEPVRFA